MTPPGGLPPDPLLWDVGGAGDTVTYPLQQSRFSTLLLFFLCEI